MRPRSGTDELGDGTTQHGVEDLDGVRFHDRPWVWVLSGLFAGAFGADLWGSVAGTVLSTVGAVLTLAGTIAPATRYIDGTTHT